MESLGPWLVKFSLVLAVILTVLTMWAWGSHIGPTSTGELCGARVYSFRPGHGTRASSGEMSAAARHSVDVPCQVAAKPYWDRGVLFAWGAVGAVLVSGALTATSRLRAASVPRPPTSR